MATTVQIIGLKEANRALKRLPESAKVKAQQTMDVTAFQVAREASTKAPRSHDGSHGHSPGFLARSIQWESRPRSVSAIVGIAKAAFYWRFLEFGTVKLTARPFLRPAADANRADHHRRMIQALARAADQIANEAK